MKAKLLALAIISAFALSACGSDDKKPRVNNNTKPAAQNTQGQNQQGQNQQGQNQQGQNQQGGNQQGQNQQGQNQQGGNQQGGNQQGQNTATETPYDMEQQIAVYQYNSEMAGKVQSVTTTPQRYESSNGDGKDFLKVVVDGKTFELDKYSFDLFDQDKNKIIASIIGKGRATTTAEPTDMRQLEQPYAVYGYIRYGDTAGTNEIKGFYQGIPTEINDMPTTGIVTYNGEATILDNNVSCDGCSRLALTNISGKTLTSRATFSADFANKKLTGTINENFSKMGFSTSNQYKPINIDATIKANTFKGTANTTGTVEGKFYGPKAQNIAGAFNDKSQNLQGVFGATKQE